MKIGVVGCGYVGLSTAVAIARNKEIVVWDRNENIINGLYAGKIPFEDIELNNAFKKYGRNIVYCKNVLELVEKSDIYILALSTDYSNNTKALDTSGIEELINIIVNNKERNTFKIIIKSTVPIGFTKKMREKFNCINIFFVPEFLREGNAYFDVINPSRVIIGGTESELCGIIDLIYKGTMTCEIQYVSTTEAESIKLFSNAYLAMRVAFFNELDQFAEKMNMSSINVINGVCGDFRIGTQYNNPSFGFGGYCLPKDSKQLVSSLNGEGILINAIVQSNEKRKKDIANRFIREGKRVGIYRLQMKKNSDNIRGAAIIDILIELLNKGVKVAVYEPLINKGGFLNGAEIVGSLESLVKKSDIIITNRMCQELVPYKEIVYTRDVFFRD